MLMEVGFLFGVMEMFWGDIVVMEEYTKNTELNTLKCAFYVMCILPQLKKPTYKKRKCHFKNQTMHVSAQCRAGNIAALNKW